MWILDTDHLSLLLQGNLAITNKLAVKVQGEVVITVVTAEEQIWGRLSAIRQASQASNADKLLRAYLKFRLALNDLLRFTILDFTQAAHLEYQELRRQKISTWITIRGLDNLMIRRIIIFGKDIDGAN